MVGLWLWGMVGVTVVEDGYSYDDGRAESSFADPDPHGSPFILVGWIRIQEGQNDPPK
jgi:hypothetical protein